MENKFKIKLPFMKKSVGAKASAKAHHARLGKDPYFDWAIILSLFFVTMVLWLSFGFALWHIVETESFDSSSISSAVASMSVTSTTSTLSTVPSLNTTALEKMIAAETAKSQSTAQYGAGYSGPVDPSH